MANSMTAFARETSTTEWGTVTCELRSVNHRYLETNPRLSEELRRLESRIRAAVNKRVERGRIDCFVRLQAHDTTQDDFLVDRALVARVVKLADETLTRFPCLTPLPVSEVLRWPGVVRPRDMDSDLLLETAMTLVERALDRIGADRSREGQRLKATVEQRLDKAGELVRGLKARIPELGRLFRQRVTDKLEEVSGKLEPQRLEQELALYVQKTDVTEEIDRLEIHLDEVRKVLGHSGAIGRRLDFLMQELHREANTLGSKSFDMALTQASVELKVLIEQMREQVQNIE